MAYSNAHILAAVLTFWARPAISQVATAKLAQLPMMQSLQQSIVGMGLVNSAYTIANDLHPLILPMVNNVLQPYLEKMFSQIPDEALPGLARDIIADAQAKGSYTILDGLITLEVEDIKELKALVEKNLPQEEKTGYIINN